jgi:hypothetical protein
VRHRFVNPKTGYETRERQDDGEQHNSSSWPHCSFLPSSAVKYNDEAV